MWKLCAIGEALIDFVPLEKGERLKDVQTFRRVAGGAPANVAGAYCKLGGQAKMITKLGKDAFGDHILDVLRENHVDVHAVIQSDEADTSLAFVSLRKDGNRDFMFYRRNCADLSLTYDELDEQVLDDCQILHFCSVSLVESPMKKTHLQLLKKAKEKGMLISFDPNLRQSLWNDDEGLYKTVLEFLPFADIVKISDEELEFITMKKTIEEALPMLFSHASCQLVIYTEGSHGAQVYTRKDHACHKGFHVEAVDTTGAGDAFIASFLYMLAKEEILPQKADAAFLEKAVRFSNGYAAMSTLKSGALASYGNRMQTYCFIKEKEKQRLETSRLLLRPFELKDAQDCFAFLSDATTCQMDGGYLPYTEMDEAYDELMTQFAHQQRYMIELKENRHVIGTIHLMRKEEGYEIGYVIAPLYQRQGYAYEALESVLKAYHECSFSATVYPNNVASIHLLEKLGFQKSEHTEHSLFYQKRKG